LTDKKENNKTSEETTDEVNEQAPQVAQQNVNPREVLLQVFEQGARASSDWDLSQLRIQCLMALQQEPNLADLSADIKAETKFVLDELLKSGQLQFGLQQILYPMVKELE
tara:strand:- start:5406 stop:5735 length:330 start_codon:yes stop_codon:yes gene_type:complete